MGPRREVPPAEQLENLRRARDHYYALADRIRDGEANSSETSEERLARERDARRIAAAYDKSFNIQKAMIGRRLRG